MNRIPHLLILLCLLTLAPATVLSADALSADAPSATFPTENPRSKTSASKTTNPEANEASSKAKSSKTKEDGTKIQSPKAAETSARTKPSKATGAPSEATETEAGHEAGEANPETTEAVTEANSPRTAQVSVDSVFDDPSAVLPPAVTADMDSLYLAWRREGLFHLCDSCLTDAADTLRPADSVYRQRLQDLPSIIPMAYNRVVKRFIELYAYERRQQVAGMLALSDFYFPIIEQELDVAGLPLELKYLPIIESALNTNAVSPMGAVGLWQFMYSTGKVYGLQINSLVDERRDPVRSTQAAVRFLKALYQMFGDWNLALAAYNCGPGNVRKAISRAGGKRDFWDIYYYLPRETRSYVPLFYAAHYIMEYHELHGICPGTADRPLVCDTLMIHNDMHFRQISDVCSIPYPSIKKANPQFRSDIVHGTATKPAVLYLPAEYTPTFISMQDSIPNYRKAELLTANLSAAPANPGGRENGEAVIYRVKSGDNLSVIAKRYHVTVNNLRKWNNLKSDMLKIGQRLIIY